MQENIIGKSFAITFVKPMNKPKGNSLGQNQHNLPIIIYSVYH